MSEAIEIAAPSTALLSFAPCWFDAPAERSPFFFPTFSRVAVVLQATLRRELPARYLADVERFRDSRMVYPLLMYTASRPFPGERRTDFTYDVLNSALMRRFYYSVRQNLPRMLEEVCARLRDAGMNEVVRDYRPDRFRELMATVDDLKICRRRLEGLLIAETWMVDDLVRFAGSSQLPERAKAKLVASIERQWLARLRSLWAKQDFSELGPEILTSATAALSDCLEKQTQDFRASEVVTQSEAA